MVANSRANWVRDEVILALDLYFHTLKKTFSTNDKEVIELSALLNELPIIPVAVRTDDFRNVNGMHYQLTKLKLHVVEGKPLKIGKVFIDVYDEFCNDKQTLHEIATAIKNSKNILKTISFGDSSEGINFKEGALLSHLHRYFENKYLLKYANNFLFCHCAICKLDVNQAYRGSAKTFYELHLMIPPKDYHDESKFYFNDFIMVCPNCHKALHLMRPWVNKNEINKILK